MTSDALRRKVRYDVMESVRISFARQVLDTIYSAGSYNRFWMIEPDIVRPLVIEQLRERIKRSRLGKGETL